MGYFFDKNEIRNEKYKKISYHSFGTERRSNPDQGQMQK